MTLMISIKNGFMGIINWVITQIDWLKGFMEEQLPTGMMKPSNKRLISTLVVVAFLYSYVFVLIKRNDLTSKISEIVFPDIPSNWAFLIGYIIGANIYSNIQSAKATKDMTVAKGNIVQDSKLSQSDSANLTEKIVENK